MSGRCYLTYLIIVFVLISCDHGRQNNRKIEEGQETTAITAKTIIFNVLDTFQHDQGAFTEGLEYYKGKLYESTGKFGETSIRQIDPATGQIITKVVCGDNTIFGEGITYFKGSLYQLTYQNHQVLVYKDSDLQHPILKLNWPKEGWGLTHDSTSLILSDGSTTIYYLRPEDVSITKTLNVMYNDRALDKLNELEFIDGFIYANRWYDDKIYKIDTLTGNVVGEMHFEGLLEHYMPTYIRNEEDVLNGIAWNEREGQMYVTGKNWPIGFKIQIQ